LLPAPKNETQPTCQRQRSGQPRGCWWVVFQGEPQVLPWPLLLRIISVADQWYIRYM